jgi:hypothetical protein
MAEREKKLIFAFKAMPHDNVERLLADDIVD